ncbi:high-affinity nickel transporter [Metarhizium album ARSEF 1941]|uniref:High-affinity nickel transporter n=1 Tax=Metarhizium album (strain ARSEF 1941) TaxID=1081103 RepID=A0A0B2X586_METAS|nr:high-affinity nickel transporter [Metarhizium album ARSEF 1941]KHO00908.1 high-affinity nickel transporter [Metarhizium album ARSEF 1941]
MASNLDFPRIYLLPSHLEPSQLHYFEDVVPSLTYNIQEAELVLGKISKRERAEFELRRLKLKIRPWLGEDPPSVTHTIAPVVKESLEGHPGPKRRKLGDVEHLGPGIAKGNMVQVLRLSWLTDCLAQGKLLPVDNYLLCEGFKIASDVDSRGERRETQNVSTGAIVQRAAEDHAVNSANRITSSALHFDANGPRRVRHRPPPLERQTTSEHDTQPPAIPDFLHTTYSCQRPTPLHPPNEEFILELKKIRTFRILQGNQIGARAYSTSIAALSAYPHVIKGPHGK